MTDQYGGNFDANNDDNGNDDANHDDDYMMMKKCV